MVQVSLSTLITAARSGDRIISFPTDTVPALAVRPDCAALIFAAKQRSQAKPLILMGADAADLWPYVQGTAAELQCWQTVVATHWPGALTLVLPASDRLPPQLNPLNPTTVGIRVPNRAIARHILAQTGPLATTSANASGQPPLETLAAIAAQFPQVMTPQPQELDQVEQTLPATSPSPGSVAGTPSTVAQWTGSGWSILRQGSVQLP